MIKKVFYFTLVLAAFSSAQVFGQDTPSDIRYLVGARASSAEDGLRRAGFEFVKTTEGGDRKWSNWWSNSRNVCITVTTYDGRYQSIITSPALDCNRSGGPTWGGGNNQTSTPPSWAQGTFYSSSPSVTMTINRNGQVTSVINGQTFYGRFYRGSIYAGNEVATVTRSGNGIRTYNRTTGQTIEFGRNFNGGGGGNSQTSTPPSWARGTFYSSNPNVTMTIANNGQVTSIVEGQSYYGRYYNGTIYSQDSSATVSRTSNGIRTYNTTSGQTINFSRSAGGSTGGGNWGGDKVNLSDLVGIRASSGESELRSRGFRNVDGFKTGSTSYTIWWRGQSRQCIQVATADGRYDSVTDIGTHPKCN